jgi:predicted HAD superfamily Cof-like phosphohydrolase
MGTGLSRVEMPQLFDVGVPTNERAELAPVKRNPEEQAPRSADSDGAEKRSVQDMVADFHRMFGVPLRTCPTPEVPSEEAALRIRLLDEELSELKAAIASGDLIAIADGLGDLAYVLYGSALTFGIDLDAVVSEIHRSNLSKLGQDGRPIRRADGKVLKSPNYSPPRLDWLLESGRPEPDNEAPLISTAYRHLPQSR